MLCKFCCKKRIFVWRRIIPIVCRAVQSQMSFLPLGHPLKYKQCTTDMANGVLIGPSPLGDGFVNITYELGGEVVHHDRAPLANMTFPSAVPLPDFDITSCRTRPSRTTASHTMCRCTLACFGCKFLRGQLFLCWDKYLSCISTCPSSRASVVTIAPHETVVCHQANVARN